MITLHIEVPYASFRKSYARSFAETYPLPPPATVYGMLLSLVGERFRGVHTGVRLAFAYKCRCADEANGGWRVDGICEDKCLPHIATTLRKLSRFKYGVGGKEGVKPDFVETLCDIEFLCWVDSSQELSRVNGSEASDGSGRNLEERILKTLSSPTSVTRYGVLCLGLSDDAVNDVSLCESIEGKWHCLLPSDIGTIELPIWVDHVGAARTRWQRYELEMEAHCVGAPMRDNYWTQIVAPQ